MDIRAQPCVLVIDEIDGHRYKLLYYYETNGWELYNLSDDWEEKRNIIKNHPKLAKNLSQKIQRWLNQKHSTWKPKYPLSKKDNQPQAPSFIQ